MLYFTEEDVRRMLPMAEAIRLMQTVFERLASGEAINQPRRRLALPTGSALHYMAGSDGKYFGTKLYSTHPKHGARFVFLLYRAEDGEPLATFEAAHLGQIRTGAASGVATSWMARQDANVVGVIGSGFQARTQVDAMMAVRHVDRVLVWSRNAEKRDRFAAELPNAVAASTAEAAVRDAGIVITATDAKDPVLADEWVSPGAHVNAMGSNQAKRRELPADLVRRADCIAVDSIEQARMESGDLLLALEEEDWKSSRLVELQEVVSGRVAVREHPNQITIFKSNGLAVEDVIVAGFIYEQAVRG